MSCQLELCKRTDYLSTLWQQACAGDSEAQFSLGFAFNVGKNGLEKDLQYAIRFYLKAGEQGNAKAAWNLSVTYRDDPTLKDEHKRFFYVKMAAELGDAAGQNALGCCYVHGLGTAVNGAEAVRYYQLSADQHNPFAECNLARCFYSGLCGAAKNLPRALKYYKLALQHEYADAAAQVSVLEGLGVVAEP